MPIDYEDQRFQDVKEAEKTALSEAEQTYGSMIQESKDFYKEQVDSISKMTTEQQQLQQEQTDFAVEKLEQQKQQAQKDYIKEQSGAYVDWKKQSNRYGANAEQMADMGMTGTGFSESSQTAMYNAYQARVTAARETVAQAVLQYDNAIKDAQLQGSAAMAEIALQGFQQQMELALQGFQYENQLLQQLLDQKIQVQQNFYSRWQDVQAQLNNEAAMQEEKRQFDEQMDFKQKEYDEGVRRFNEELAEEIRQFNEQMATKNGKSGGTPQTEPDSEPDTDPDDNPEKKPVVDNTKQYVPPKSTGKYERVALEGDTSIAADIQAYGKYSDGAPKGMLGVGKFHNTGETVSVGGQDTQIRMDEYGNEYYWDAKTQSYILLNKMSGGFNR